MLMRLTLTGALRPCLVRGLAPFWSSKMVPDPTSPLGTSATSSGEPTGASPGAPAGAPSRLVISTFVAFLRAVEHHAEQVHFRQHFLGTAQHGAAALAFR